MISGSIVKQFISERPNVRDAFIVQHLDGSEHQSTRPCAICLKLAATAVQVKGGC